MFTLNCKGQLLVVDKPLVMGIINITADSFYSGSRASDVLEVVKRAEQMLKDGASILDIGGQSTRPGSTKVDAEEEMNRVIPALEAIHRNFPEAIVSIDTYSSRVAAAAIHAGASIVNDISAGTMDPEMIPTVAAYKIPYIMMHMQGTPQTMQEKPQYENVTREVLDFFISRIPVVRQAGITDIIVDPGFGFGKTITHNFSLLRELNVFKVLGCPLLVGVSRKSTIYKTLGVSAEESLNGSTVLHTISLLHGASILRVHDVKEAVEAVTLVGQLSLK